MMLKRRGADLTGSLLFLAAILGCVSCQIEMTGSVENKTGTNESRPRIFSPRMDYDEWTPLGRGDPLKNDPTFDYVPPVLDRVQYWLDSHTTEPSAKRDILVLGVTAKKTSPKLPEQFLKFVDGPKFNRNQEQQYRNDHVVHRNDFTGSTGAEPPKIMRNTNFRNSVVDYRNQNRIQNIPASYYPSPFYNQKPKPYTMMLPPPVAPKPVGAAQPTYMPQKEKLTYAEREQNQQFSTQTEEGPVQHERPTYNNPPLNSYSQPHPPQRLQHSSSNPPPSKNQASLSDSLNVVFTPPVQTTKQKFQSATVPSVSFEKSNLVYHSTQTISGGWLANEGSPSEINQVTWQTPSNVPEHFDTTDHHAAASSSHEVVIGQNANIIVDGENADHEEVVVGKKESTVTRENVETPTSNVHSSVISTNENESTSDVTTVEPSAESSKEQMHIVVANTGSSGTTTSGNFNQKEPVTVVMPMNYMDKLNVTVGDSKTEAPNPIHDEHPNTVTSVIEQTIQISNPLPTQNLITNPPTPPPQMNQMHHMNPMNYMNQADQGNRMHNGIHMNQINQIPNRFTFPRPNAQPLIQSNENHAIMSHVMNMGMRPPVSQQMFNPQRPMLVEHRPPVFSMPHSVQTMTTPRAEIEMVRNDPYHRVQQVSSGEESRVTFLPTPLPPVLKPETVTSSLDLVTDYIKNQSPLAHLLMNNEKNDARPTTTTTTTVSSLTTDPIFSHYKQPAKPIRGPMYLIIQGHSKVKTYKPSVNRHGVPVENNEIQEVSTERPSKLEQLINENTRMRNAEKSVGKSSIVAEEERPRQKRIEQQDLLSLVDSNFSGFTVQPAPAAEEERQSNSVTTIEINN